MTDDEIREALRLDFEQTALFGTTTWTPSSTAKCSGRSVSTRGPKQPRTLLRRASPTGQWERKVRERRRRVRPARASNVPEFGRHR